MNLRPAPAATPPSPSSSPPSSAYIKDPIKAWRVLILHLTKSKVTDASSLFVRSALGVSTVASVSLLLYFTFSYSHIFLLLLSCPGCDRVPLSLQRTAAALPSVNVRLPVAADSPTNISHVLFGIGGSALTWDKRRHYCELWWRPNVTRGFVWLDQEPPENLTWPATSPPYRVSADTSRFKYSCWYGSRAAIRIARIVKESFELGLSNVRWFVMGDDDTVFFTENLIRVLSKYDHNQMYYVGANSESVEQDDVHSYTMAYGGGGFAISYPLAVELVKILDGCIDRYDSMYGSDQKVQGCLSELGVPLTKELGFHQVDIRGSPFGLLAVHPMAPLVSLHHLDYVDPIFPDMTRIDSLKRLRTAYELDRDRALQHSFCHDTTQNWSISISWGYTLLLYPSLLTAKQLESTPLTFKTWRTWSPGPFTFNIRPLSSNPCERPLIYFLDGAYGSTGETMTSYRRHVDGGIECDQPEYVAARGIDRVNVTAPYFDSGLWTKAPRRQCCEVINRGNGTENVSDIHVRIRSCNPWESVTLP